MSIHAEWVDAATVHVSMLQPHEDLAGAMPGDPDYDQSDATKSGGIVLAGDDLVVLVGSPAALEDLAKRISRAAAALALAAPPDGAA